MYWNVVWKYIISTRNKQKTLAPNLNKIEFRGFLFLLLFTALFFLSNNYKSPSNPGQPILQNNESIGEGGPNNRLAFELLRSKDPQTNFIPEGIKQRSLVFAKTLPVRNKNSVQTSSFNNTLKWSNRGPYNVGGRTRALAVDIADSNTIIAGGVSGGIWRSADFGKSWTKMTKPNQLHSVSSIAQDLRNGKTNIWYATTGELSGNSAGARGAPFRGDGIYKSVDNGFTWELLASTSTNTPESFDNYLNYGWRIKVHPTTGHVFIATFGSIYKSIDEGLTWQLILGQGSNRYSDLDMNNSGLFIAVLGSGQTKGPIFRSEDGNLWTDITPSNFPTDYGRIVVDISESNDSVAYVLITNDNGHNFLKYKYSAPDSNGVIGSWEDRSNNLPDDFNSQGGYDLHVRVSPSDENFIYFGGTNLYYSTDGMKTSELTFQLGGYGHKDHHPDQHDVLLYKDEPNKVFSASDGGLHVMNDITAFGKKWDSLNNGYLTTQFYTIAIDQTGTFPNLLMGGTQDNGTWESLKLNEENPWSQVSGGDGAYASVINFGTSYILSSQRGFTLIKDWNNPFNWNYGGGDKYSNYSWAYLYPPDFDRENEALFISPVYSNPSNDHILYYAGGNNLYRNNDVYLNLENYKRPEGKNFYESTKWEKLEKSAASGDISAFGGSLLNPANRLYYGTSNGLIYRLDNSDTSDSSVVIKNNMGAGGYISSISVDPYDGSKVMASFSNYNIKSIYYSENAGESWTDVSGNLEEFPNGQGSGPSVRSVYIYPLKFQYRYFAGTSTGLYSTDKLDGKDTKWIQEGSSTIGNIVVDMIAGRPADGYIAIATHGNGMYSSNFESEILSIDESFTPNTFDLGQNFPNPFNPSTNIPFSLSSSGLVSIKIYDLMGREVKTFLESQMTKGSHQVNWLGKDKFGKSVPTGIYIYQIKIGELIKSKKMHLLK